MKKYLLVLIFYVFCFKLNATCCYSTGNGDWNNASIWSCGHRPTCSDTVIIEEGHTVTVTTQQNYTTCVGQTLQILVKGALKFVNGFKLILPCGSVLSISETGSLVPGTGSGNSNYLNICGIVYWKAGSGIALGPACFPPGCTILPIELIYFKGNLVGKNTVELSWLTATELNNDRFEVERSIDAINFERIATIRSKAPNGLSNVNLTYTEDDPNLSNNLYYYRLKQIDFDATFRYSSIISVNVDGAEISFDIYPNPNNGEFTIDIKGIEGNSNVNLKLINQLSQYVHRSEHTIIQNARLDITPETILSKGVYIGVLNLNNVDYHFKLVVQ